MPLPRANYKQKTILCADDEPVIRELCANVLDGYHILLAENGLEAVKILETEEIDIVLSDVRMPKLGGLELLQKIKEKRPDQLVILMTGYSDQELVLKALKAGADDFINKPINILQLTTTVEKAFEKQKLRQELADLKRTDQLKSDFLGLISHKLKTPATAISLFLQNIAEGVESPDDSDFKQMVAMVQTETVHLEQLIQDLLYFSEATLQEEALTLEPIDLGQLANKAVFSLQPAALHRHINLKSAIKSPLPPVPLMLNPQRISFAIRALLDNAIKFNRENGSIIVSGKIDSEQVRLVISDTGIGIQQQELPKIFNKFYQVDPDNTGQVRGFGLGLYYARDFIRSMGGQLYIESQPGQGTVATIEFPLSS
ncbi:MAG: hybrid sensor histidine kinase/response regulator [Desulfuromonadales bacterium]|nr:hybrid sensor histidine kinase/response regulator [Desulfuromonadales bacterium]